MRTYVGGFYTFEAAPPFAPVAFTPRPILTAPALKRLHRGRLDPGLDRAIYPGGSLRREGSWVVASGVQNEYCCLHVCSHEDLLAATIACRPTNGR